ncbi:MAG: alpha-ketoglutarate-dependent dioxygenase AlkB family protein [Elsteraceae bacterium]
MKLFPDEAITAPDWRLTPGFLGSEAADRLFDALLRQTPWREDRLRLGGREVTAPRRVSWHGDPHCVYRYSGARHDPTAWFPALADLRDAVADATGHRFNCALLNLYQDGQDSMGWHSDDEPELGSNPVVASVSLGAERRFRFRSRQAPEETHALMLGHGSLLLMQPGCQGRWRHALPKSAAVSNPRINVTFRWIPA